MQTNSQLNTISRWEENGMSEEELQRLYDLLERTSDEREVVIDEEERAALRHVIFIIENNNHVY